MKTLKDILTIRKNAERYGDSNEVDYTYIKKDIKEKLNDFYNDYWKESYEGDKFKKHITCDELDYLMNKHFGSLVKIETLQDLENQEK